MKDRNPLLSVEKEWLRKEFGRPQKPHNGTGNDIASAIIYLGDCILYQTEVYSMINRKKSKAVPAKDNSSE